MSWCATLAGMTHSMRDVRTTSPTPATPAGWRPSPATDLSAEFKDVRKLQIATLAAAALAALAALFAAGFAGYMFLTLLDIQSALAGK